jgi:hypothetical protein
MMSVRVKSIKEMFIMPCSRAESKLALLRFILAGGLENLVMAGDLGPCRVPFGVMSPINFLPWVVFNKQGKD